LSVTGGFLQGAPERVFAPQVISFAFLIMPICSVQAILQRISLRSSSSVKPDGNFGKVGEFCIADLQLEVGPYFK
jgi:hypothetical protein